MKLLWRCFHFYAHHPFPSAATDRQIVHAAAFQRAISLLVYEQTSFLGTQDDGGYFWRQDEAFFHRASFKRMLRSIGSQYDTGKSMPQLEDDAASILDDTLDVLSTTQPYAIHVSPPPDQLKGAASRLLGEALYRTSTRTSREDLTLFVDLLLQFNLDSFDRPDHTGTSLANILVSGLGDEQWQNLTSDHVNMAMRLLVSNVQSPPERCCTISNIAQPNMHSRFHQLWAALFQPPRIEHEPVKSLKPGYASQHLLAAISLFISQPVKPTPVSWTSITSKDMPITFESCNKEGQSRNDLTVTSLVKALTHDSRPYVVLITGEQDAEMSAAVIGAYFPGPLWLHDSNTGNKREYKAGRSHLLFQLEPKLRILRWTVPEVPLLDIIISEHDRDDESASLLDTIPEVSDEMNPGSSEAYKIGGPEKGDTGLCIDPETRMATLSNRLGSTGSKGGMAWYEDLYSKGDEQCGGNNAEQTWEVKTKISRLEIFSVSNSVGSDLADGRMTRVKDHARNIQEAKDQVKIEGDALKKRIQGFGYVPT